MMMTNQQQIPLKISLTAIKESSLPLAAFTSIGALQYKYQYG